MIFATHNRYVFNSGPGSLTIQDEGGVDLGHEGDLAWAEMTRDVLDQSGNVRGGLNRRFSGG